MVFFTRLPTAAVAKWLEGLTHEWEVVRLTPGRDRPKSLKKKLVVMAFPLATQNYGNSTTTGLPVSG